DGGDRRDFHGVVLALTPPALAHLLCDPAAYGVASLDGSESFPIVDVHLWHDRGSLGFDFAALLDSPVQWIFEKAPGYLCCSLSAATDDVRLSNDELVQRSWREVVRAIPLLDGAQLVLGAATRTPQATFLAKLDVARASAATTIPNLALAGSWTDTGWPDTMESAVISGKNAARLLVDALSSGNRAPLEGTSVA
ncbi:MAG: FAD-dependent oxidoreductase, partial [Candidatus Eremiobacteraeota bacterium]|nr:FAD-dependent oxidoreductase [Candidatus Eremiobacteraeota bacterium]